MVLFSVYSSCQPSNRPRRLMSSDAQGHRNNEMEILLYAGFPAFNIVVRMQVGSIAPTVCSAKGQLCLNHVGKLNVILNVWYEYVALIWDWLEAAIFWLLSPHLCSFLAAQPSETEFPCLFALITPNCTVTLAVFTVVALLLSLPERINIHLSCCGANKDEQNRKSNLKSAGPVLEEVWHLLL